MRTELWKSVKNYEGIYEVSNLGNVRSVERTITLPNGFDRTYKTKRLKPVINNRGYAQVFLYKKGVYKHELIHRLVYQAFKGELEDGLVIDHKNENQSNNKLENLQQITQGENIRKAKAYKKLCREIAVQNLSR